MSQVSLYDELIARLKNNIALSQIAANLQWDQEVMMPPDGATARAEQAAALETVTHRQWTDPALGDLIGSIDEKSLGAAEAANLRLAKREYESRTRMPETLATEIARVTSAAQQVWAAAREKRDFAAFAPQLKHILELKRQQADCLRDDGASRYDALLDGFEPGMTSAVLQPLLEGLRPRLSALRAEIAESGRTQPRLDGTFDTDKQMKLARHIATALGFDWQAGRLDLSVHPFSSGTARDVRITTRLDPENPLDCLYSTIHELGHALYEQGLPADHEFTPAGQHVSMGVHESQSRLWENQIGRSAAFAQWLYPTLSEIFPDHGLSDEDALYRAVNQVEPGFIRTEADEVHYNLHILMRFELERELIAGDLEVADLESEWNRRFERDFGRAVPHAALGVLQDIHWAEGLFGYFPTYALGNIYAAQLFACMKRDLTNVEETVANGNMAPILAWLHEKIHAQGSLQPPDRLVESVVGTPVSAEPLLDYLEAKFRPIYAL